MVDFSHLWAEPFPIPAHALCALGALVLGVVQLLLPKGTGAHRIMGYVWAALMATTALTAVFISELRIWGRFSPIHLLIPVTFFGLWRGIRAARQGDIRGHKSAMVQVFILAVVVTGGFTLLPGRVMHAVLFGG